MKINPDVLVPREPSTEPVPSTSAQAQVGAMDSALSYHILVESSTSSTDTCSDTSSSTSEVLIIDEDRALVDYPSYESE